MRIRILLPMLSVALSILSKVKKGVNLNQNNENKKSERRDLNPRPPLPQSGALPSCATPRYSTIIYHSNILSNCQVKKALKIG